MSNFRESGHSVFCATSALDRGQLPIRGGGKLFIHFCADYATIDTNFGTIVSVSQLSIYDTVADLCAKFGHSIDWLRENLCSYGTIRVNCRVL